MVLCQRVNDEQNILWYTCVMVNNEQNKSETVEDETNDFGDIYATWEFSEHEKHQRSKVWYLIFGIIIVALFTYAYFDANPLLALIVILGMVTFIVSEFRGPDIHNCVITEDGLILGAVFYGYDEIKNFYIIFQPPKVKMLYIEPKGIWRQRVGIPLESQDPVAIRELLLEFLPEDMDKEDEPASDFIGRLFKF
jgi:hypothetical protein